MIDEKNTVCCVFCNGTERNYQPDNNVVRIICTNCFHKLCSMPQSKIQEVYRMAIEKGYPAKAEALKPYLEEKEHVPKTDKFRRGVDRKRIVHKIRPRDKPKNRPKPKAGELDQRRVEMR